MASEYYFHINKKKIVFVFVFGWIIPLSLNNKEERCIHIKQGKGNKKSG